MAESAEGQEKFHWIDYVSTITIEIVVVLSILTLLIFVGIYTGRSASEISSFADYSTDSNLQTAHHYISTASWLIWIPAILAGIMSVILVVFLIILSVLLVLFGPEILLALGVGAEGGLDVAAASETAAETGEETSLATKSLAANQAKQSSSGFKKFLVDFGKILAAIIKYTIVVVILILLIWSIALGILCLIGINYLTKSSNYKDKSNTGLQNAKHNATVAYILAFIPIALVLVYLLYKILIYFEHKSEKKKA